MRGLFFPAIVQAVLGEDEKPARASRRGPPIN